MEIAFLNALTKSAYMPPYDPYFAGGYINYYYFGHFVVNVLIKLTGIKPEVAFNLAVSSLFALAVGHVFALGYALWGRSSRHVSRSGLLAGSGAVLLVMLAGNLSGIVQIVEDALLAGGAPAEGFLPTWETLGQFGRGALGLLSGKTKLPPFDYWYRATRIIPFTINEFPFFSFLFADLHPHMMALPFALLVPAQALAILRSGARGTRIGAIRWALLALTVGSLGVINTWDLPTSAVLLLIVFVCNGFRRRRARDLLGSVLTFAALITSSLLIYGPFYASFRVRDVGLSLVAAEDRSPLGPFLAIWGFLLFLVISLLASWLWERDSVRGVESVWRRRGCRRALHLLWLTSRRTVVVALLRVVIIAVSLAGSVAWAAEGQPVLAILTPVLVVLGVHMTRSRDRVELLLRRAILFVGVGILFGVEIVYLRDFLDSGDWRRMNTVFKFGLQAWVLIAVVCGSALPYLWRRAQRWGKWRGKIAWRAALVLLLSCSLLYTALAIPARVSERFGDTPSPARTLDGTVYMRDASYAWPDADSVIQLEYDREAIEWLWEHVPGTPVIAEAPVGFYREGGLRVSSYTGLPTLVGAHQREQRPWDQVGPREEDATAIYETTDLDELRTLLGRHRVRFIYVGQLERTLYEGPGLAKFDSLVQLGELSRVFRNARSMIYEVL